MGKYLFARTQIASIQDDKPVRLTISGIAEEELWLTQIEGDVTPNYQLMYAIGQGAYLNAFSQRLSMFVIQGVYVTCDDVVSKIPPFLKFYWERNIVSSTTPTVMTYNGLTLKGYMVDLRLSGYSKDGIDGHMFTLKFLGRLDNPFEPAQTRELAEQQSTEAADTIASAHPPSADYLESTVRADPPDTSLSMPNAVATLSGTGTGTSTTGTQRAFPIDTRTDGVV